MNKTVVKTHLIRKNFIRKDGKRQLKILAKIGYNSLNKFHELQRFEVKILKNKQLYTVSDNEYVGLQNNVSEERLSLFEIEKKIQFIIIQFVDNSEKITSETIHTALNQIESIIENKKTVGEWNKFLSQYNIEVNKKEIDEIEKEMDSLKIKQGYITDEDIANITESLQLSEAITKKNARIAKMDFNTRYRQGHFNRNNIFEVFGFLWSTNPQNNDPYIATSYRSLILQLNDYRFRATPMQSIKDFNTDWIDSFFQYLVKNGYPNIRIPNYDPFNIIEFRERIIASKRTLYKVQSFEKVVKHFKRYLALLKEHNLIAYNKEVSLISPKKYLSRNIIKDNFTKKEFSLTPDEYNKFALTDFKNERLNLARDMFVIMVQGGGI